MKNEPRIIQSEDILRNSIFSENYVNIFEIYTYLDIIYESILAYFGFKWSNSANDGTVSVSLDDCFEFLSSLACILFIAFCKSSNLSFGLSGSRVVVTTFSMLCSTDITCALSLANPKFLFRNEEK